MHFLLFHSIIKNKADSILRKQTILYLALNIFVVVVCCVGRVEVQIYI